MMDDSAKIKINKKLMSRFGREGDRARYRIMFNHVRLEDAREWRWGVYDKFVGNIWVGRHHGLAERRKYSYLPEVWILEQLYQGPIPEDIKIDRKGNYELMYNFMRYIYDKRGRPIKWEAEPVSFDYCCDIINTANNKVRKLFENHDGQPHYTRNWAAEEEERKQKEIRSDMDKIETRSELFAFESAVGYRGPTPFWTPDGQATTFEAIRLQKEVTSGSVQRSNASISSTIPDLRPATGGITGNKHKEVSSIGSEGVRRSQSNT